MTNEQMLSQAKGVLRSYEEERYDLRKKLHQLDGMIAGAKLRVRKLEKDNKKPS